MIAAIILATILFIGLAWTSLDWAVLLIIAALPTYLIRFTVAGLPLTFLEVMVLSAFAIWFVKHFLPGFKKLMRDKSARLNYPYSIELILMLVISLVAVGMAGWSNDALGIWKAYFFEPALLFILLFNVFKKRSDWLKALTALAISAAAVSLFAILQQITGLYISNPFWAAADTRRVVSFFGYPNAVGLYLAPLVMIMSGWLASLNWEDGVLFHDKLKKILLSGIIIISILAIYFAKSEGALIGLAAGFFILGILSGRKTKIISLSILVIICSGIAFYQPAREQIIQKATLSDLSGSIRKQQWKETFMALKGPRMFTGFGLNGYQTAVKQYHQEGLFYNSDNLPDFDTQLRASAVLRTKYWQPVEIYLYPHNIFLNFWTELGLLGALLFSWIVGKHLFITFLLSKRLRAIKNNDRYIVLGLLAAMVAILIHGLVDVPYFKNDLAMMFWLIIALNAALKINYQTNKK